MDNTDNDQKLINHYKGFIMNGGDMSPAINEGDHMVVDLEKTVIRSGEIYIIEYKESCIVCRLLRDGDKVVLVFDGAAHSIDESINDINVIGRVIEVKTLI
jgi:phage repressor protein C with HTH and peptisase S24 domain